MYPFQQEELVRERARMVGFAVQSGVIEDAPLPSGENRSVFNPHKKWEGIPKRTFLGNKVLFLKNGDWEYKG